MHDMCNESDFECLLEKYCIDRKILMYMTPTLFSSINESQVDIVDKRDIYNRKCAKFISQLIYFKKDKQMRLKPLVISTGCYGIEDREIFEHFCNKNSGHCLKIFRIQDQHVSGTIENPIYLIKALTGYKKYISIRRKREIFRDPFSISRNLLHAAILEMKMQNTQRLEFSNFKQNDVSVKNTSEVDDTTNCTSSLLQSNRDTGSFVEISGFNVHTNYTDSHITSETMDNYIDGELVDNHLLYANSEFTFASPDSVNNFDFDNLSDAIHRFNQNAGY